MGRPRLETPHRCSTAGCGADFTRGGSVAELLCPRCYTRQRRGQPLTSATALPSSRIHVSLPVDLLQRLATYVADAPDSAGVSDTVGAAVLEFLERADNARKWAAHKRSSQGNNQR